MLTPLAMSGVAPIEGGIEMVAALTGARLPVRRVQDLLAPRRPTVALHGGAYMRRGATLSAIGGFYAAGDAARPRKRPRAGAARDRSGGRRHVAYSPKWGGRDDLGPAVPCAPKLGRKPLGHPAAGSHARWVSRHRRVARRRANRGTGCVAVLAIDREHVLERDRRPTAALTGFVVTVTVLVIQMATGTFSARIMRLIYRDWMLKATLAVLIGTFTYSFSVLQRIEDDFVPDLGVTLAGFFISLSLLVFIIFFDRFIRQLKPVAVAASVVSTARSTFAQTVRIADRPDIRWEHEATRVDLTLLVRASRGGAIQAVDPYGLVKWARARGAELLLPHPIGDFVQTGDVLVRVYGTGLDDRAEEELEGMIALGEERTFEQDPASRYGSWSTWQTSRDHRPSTIRRPPCKSSTTSGMSSA